MLDLIDLKQFEGHTPEPWLAQNVPGAGWDIRAHLHSWDNQLLRFYEAPITPELKPEFSKDGLTLCAILGFETYCQFNAEGWPEELAANMRLLAAAPALLAEDKMLRGALMKVHNLIRLDVGSKEEVLAEIDKALQGEEAPCKN